MNAEICRQAIHSLSRQKGLGYDLLLRCEDGPSSRLADPRPGMSTAISDSMILYGVNELTEAKQVFFNLICDAPVTGQAALILPCQVVVGVLETVNADPEFLTVCRIQKSAGPMVALARFREGLQAALIGLGDVIELGVLRIPDRMAEKVETQQQFQRAVEQGCASLQGILSSAIFKSWAQETPPSLNALLYHPAGGHAGGRGRDGGRTLYQAQAQMKVSGNISVG